MYKSGMIGLYLVTKRLSQNRRDDLSDSAVVVVAATVGRRGIMCCVALRFRRTIPLIDRSFVFAMIRGLDDFKGIRGGSLGQRIEGHLHEG